MQDVKPLKYIVLIPSTPRNSAGVCSVTCYQPTQLSLLQQHDITTHGVVLTVLQRNCLQLVCRQSRQPRISGMNTKLLTWTSSAFSSPVPARPRNSEHVSRSAQTEAIWGQSSSFIRFATASVLAQFDQFAYKDCDFSSVFRCHCQLSKTKSP